MCVFVGGWEGALVIWNRLEGKAYWLPTQKSNPFGVLME